MVAPFSQFVDSARYSFPSQRPDGILLRRIFSYGYFIKADLKAINSLIQFTNHTAVPASPLSSSGMQYQPFGLLMQTQSRR